MADSTNTPASVSSTYTHQKHSSELTASSIDGTLTITRSSTAGRTGTTGSTGSTGTAKSSKVPSISILTTISIPLNADNESSIETTQISNAVASDKMGLITLTGALANSSTAMISAGRHSRSNASASTRTITLTSHYSKVVHKLTTVETSLSTELIVVRPSQIPLTTFGFVYTQAYEVTDSDTSFITTLPKTVTVVTDVGETQVALTNYCTSTVDANYFNQNIAHSTKSSSHIKKGTIAGSVVGSVFGLALIAFLAYLAFKRFNGNSKSDTQNITEKKKPNVKEMSMSQNHSVTSSNTEDNGLFALRNNILQGFSNDDEDGSSFDDDIFTARDSGEFNDINNQNNKASRQIPRNRVIDTVYEESLESNSRRSSFSSLRNHSFMKKSISKDAIREASNGSAQQSVPMVHYAKSRLSDRYNNFGLRTYYENSRNPFASQYDYEDGYSVVSSSNSERTVSSSEPMLR